LKNFCYLIPLCDNSNEVSPEDRDLLIDAPFISCFSFVSISFMRESLQSNSIYFLGAINIFFPESFRRGDKIDVPMRFEEVGLVEIFISAFAVRQEFRQLFQERSRYIICDMQLFHHLHHSFIRHVVGIYHPLIGEFSVPMRGSVDRVQSSEFRVQNFSPV